MTRRSRQPRRKIKQPRRDPAPWRREHPAGDSLPGAAKWCGLAAQVTLSEVDVQPPVDIAGQTAPRRVAPDLEHRGAGWQERGAAVDERDSDVAVIVACGQRAPDAGDNRAELVRADGHRRAGPGDVLPAVELQKVNPLELNPSPVR